MGPIGMPEAFVIVFGLLFWAVPIVAVIWALLTLLRIRRTLDQMNDRLARIEAQGSIRP